MRSRSQLFHFLAISLSFDDYGRFPRTTQHKDLSRLFDTEPTLPSSSLPSNIHLLHFPARPALTLSFLFLFSSVILNLASNRLACHFEQFHNSRNPARFRRSVGCFTVNWNHSSELIYSLRSWLHSKTYSNYFCQLTRLIIKLLITYRHTFRSLGNYLQLHYSPIYVWHFDD